MNDNMVEIEETGENIIPEELKQYLEADSNVTSKIEDKIANLDEQIVTLNNEKIESEKNFEERLNNFKEELNKERELALENFAKREKDIIDEKDNIIGIKAKETANQTSYINNLISISNEYDSKISSVKDAIKTCGESDTLQKALEEEENKKTNKLVETYDERKKALDEVLESIGEKKTEINIEVQPEIDVNPEPSYVPEKENEDNNNNENINVEYEGEIVSHESREDVVNDLFGSEEVMEGHVFPFLKSIA